MRTHPRPPLRWTPTPQLIFLVILERTGSPAQAAEAAGLSRESAYRNRRRHPGRLLEQSLGVRHATPAPPLRPLAPAGSQTAGRALLVPATIVTCRPPSSGWLAAARFLCLIGEQ